MVFSQNEKEETLPTGTMLGQFQSELKPGEHITYWACGGPKSYSYRTNLGKDVFKVKGLTINASNADIFKLENLQEMVIDNSIWHQVLSPYKILRVKGSFDLLSKPQTKIFRFTFDKRRILDDKISTVPFGFLAE